jgi:hypothetical protein
MIVRTSSRKRPATKPAPGNQYPGPVSRPPSSYFWVPFDCYLRPLVRDHCALVVIAAARMFFLLDHRSCETT